MADQPQNNNKWKIIQNILMNAGGIALGLIALWMFNNYVSNHASENTEAWNRNTEALIELKSSIEIFTEASRTQAETFGTLKDFIIQLNKR